MRFTVLIGHGPEWKPGKSVYEQGPSISGHLEAMRAHYAAGRLLLGGPFDHDGGIAVLEVPDKDAAIALMEADPGVIAEVFSYDVRALNAYFDAFAGVGTTHTVEELEAARNWG
jgi:uncharacterized protein YciI